jgi:hypothetical protein
MSHVGTFIGLLLIVCFIVAGAWWRASGYHAEAGIGIVIAGMVVVLLIYAFLRARRRT